MSEIDLMAAAKAEIVSTIKETVNGKIDTLTRKVDDHNLSHEKDMRRILPIIEAFEAAERRVDDAKSAGKSVLWISGVITAIGGAYLIIKQIFFSS